MRIDSIELVGYRRLMTDQVSVFKMTLTQMIQLILGTNGSGKSSLMAELTPLPADGTHFRKGGYKLLHITHHGSKYELKNDFARSSKGEHSFIKNGEELNKSRLQTTQIELVWEHFRFNKELRDLLQGNLKFSKMKATPRRQWLTRLSDVSFDYALDVYQRTKSKYNSVNGFLRESKERLVAERVKIMTDEEQVQLRKEVEAIHHELSELLEMRAPLEHDRFQLENKQQAMLAELNTLSLRLLKMRHFAPSPIYGGEEMYRDDWGQLQVPRFKSVEDVDRYLNRLKERIAAEEAVINKSVKDHGKLVENLAVLKKTGEAGAANLQKTLADLISQRDTTLARRKLSLEGFDPIAALASLNDCQDTLNSIFSVIPQNEDRRFSQAAIQTLQGELTEQRKLELNYRGHLEKLDGQKTHLESHKQAGNVECPTCHTRFTPGFSEARLREVCDSIERGRTKHAELVGRIKEQEERLEALTEYGTLYRQYVGTTRSYPALRPFWDYLDREQLPIVAPRMVLTQLHILRGDLGVEGEASKLERAISDQRDLIAQKALVGDASLQETQEKLLEITLAVESMTAHLAKLRQRYSEHAEYRRSLMEALTLGEEVSKLEQNVTKLTGDLVETMRRETIAHCIRQLQSQLNKKEETLATVRQQQTLVADLEKQIATYSVKETALKALLDTLSPTDGLIAEGLLGFIRNFTKQMNGIIKKIWSYPLVVKECGVSDNTGVELDYMFPMLVMNCLPVDDVSEGSTGMQDVVDLAFVTVAMKYLGLADFPLYLDEFSKSFDVEHKRSAMEALRTLMETHAFSQMFMISHDYQNYSSFNRVEVCVLDPKNIVVPDTYNQHVTIQ
jgi:hypothetical protein